jgi:hypothetical protein
MFTVFEEENEPLTERAKVIIVDQSPELRAGRGGRAAQVHCCY